MFRHLFRGVFFAALSVAFAAAIVGCQREEEGTGEQMGRQIDEAGEAATQAAEDAGEAIGEAAEDLTGGGG